MEKEREKKITQVLATNEKKKGKGKKEKRLLNPRQLIKPIISVVRLQKDKPKGFALERTATKI